MVQFWVLVHSDLNIEHKAQDMHDTKCEGSNFHFKDPKFPMCY
jgi:hypothetical protein